MAKQQISYSGNKRTSDLLEEIVELPDQGTITIGKFVDMLGDRSFSLCILIFSLPNSLPVPGIPGFSTITGLPILLIAMQIVYGRRAIWLPRKVADKSFKQSVVVKIVKKALPVILWMERFVRPRLTFLCDGLGEKIIGLLIVVMAAILSLPIVGGNFLPGFAISLMALALLENDGVFAVLSAAFTVGSVYLMLEIIAKAFEWVSGLI